MTVKSAKLCIHTILFASLIVGIRQISYSGHVPLFTYFKAQISYHAYHDMLGVLYCMVMPWQALCLLRQPYCVAIFPYLLMYSSTMHPSSPQLDRLARETVPLSQSLLGDHIGAKLCPPAALDELNFLFTIHVVVIVFNRFECALR